MMTVKELIKLLQQYPDDMPVIRDCGGDCSGFTDIVSTNNLDCWCTGVISVCDSIQCSYGGNYWEKTDVDTHNRLYNTTKYKPNYFKALILR